MEKCLFALASEDLFVILLQRGIATSLPRPPPFLGVSSLNLAAPRSGHFWIRKFAIGANLLA